MKRFILGVLVILLAMGFLLQTGADVRAADKYPSKQINWYIHSIYSPDCNSPAIRIHNRQFNRRYRWPMLLWIAETVARS